MAGSDSHDEIYGRIGEIMGAVSRVSTRVDTLAEDMREQLDASEAIVLGIAEIKSGLKETQTIGARLETLEAEVKSAVAFRATLNGVILGVSTLIGVVGAVFGIYAAVYK